MDQALARSGELPGDVGNAAPGGPGAGPDALERGRVITGVVHDLRSVLVDEAGGNLVGVYFVPVRKRVLVALRIGARLDIYPVRLEKVLRHVAEPGRAVHLEG